MLCNLMVGAFPEAPNAGITTDAGSGGRMREWLGKQKELDKNIAVLEKIKKYTYMILLFVPLKTHVHIYLLKKLCQATHPLHIKVWSIEEISLGKAFKEIDHPHKDRQTA